MEKETERGKRERIKTSSAHPETAAKGVNTHTRTSSSPRGRSSQKVPKTDWSKSAYTACEVMHTQMGRQRLDHLQKCYS